MNSFVQCGDKSLNLQKPVVMGILNITPDSFYEDSRYHLPSEMLKAAEKMIEDGALVLDLGAVSTRPGAILPDASEEAEKLIPMVKLIRKYFPQVIISADTFRSDIAWQAVNEGAGIINDISGGQLDQNMFSTMTGLDAAYVLMHMQGTPETMQDNPVYNDIVSEVHTFFQDKVKSLRDLGVENIIIDPGFGFGKSIDHNYQLIRHLQKFKDLECPILAGLSRKSMIYKPLGINPRTALNGTSVLNTMSLLNGANILRVHDVKEAVETIKLVTIYLDNCN